MALRLHVLGLFVDFRFKICSEVASHIPLDKSSLSLGPWPVCQVSWALAGGGAAALLVCSPPRPPPPAHFGFELEVLIALTHSAV